METLFAFVAGWPCTDSKGYGEDERENMINTDSGISLNVAAYWPSDPGQRDGGSWLARRRQVRLGGADLLQKRFAHSYLELQENEFFKDNGGDASTLELRGITKFAIRRGGGKDTRKISATSCCHLAMRMPRLKTLELLLNDDEKQDTNGRIRQHIGMYPPNSLSYYSKQTPIETGCRVNS